MPERRLSTDRIGRCMKILYCSLALAGVLGLAACAAVGPDYERPSTEVPPAWKQSGVDEASAADSAPAGDLSQWWQRLQDPLLTELVDEAFRASPDLRTAQARLREARARRVVAAAGKWPSVNANASATRTESSAESGTGGSRELYSAGFDASWEADVFGGVRRAVEAADADLGASQEDLNATRVSLAAEVASTYIEARVQQMLLEVARANLDTQTQTLQLTRWRAEAGLVNIQDVEQARSSSEQTRAQIPALQTSLAQAEHALDILLGYLPGSVHNRLAEAGRLPLVPERVAVGIPADTLRQRPDVRVAERTLAAETARVGVAQAARYPRFTLSGSIGLEALTLGGLGNSGATASSLRAGITAPIFDAGRLRAQVDVQDAVRERAYIAYERAVLVALQEVEDALVEISHNRARDEALASALGAARNAVNLARHRYGAGLIDFQSVLDGERSVLSLEQTWTRNRADGVLALIRLYKALGGGWTPESVTGGGSASPRTTTDERDSLPGGSDRPQQPGTHSTIDNAT